MRSVGFSLLQLVYENYLQKLAKNLLFSELVLEVIAYSSIP